MALIRSESYEEFKQQLEINFVHAVERVGKDGDIIGITFVDDEYKNIMNGSEIGREFSFANIQKNFEESSNTQGHTLSGTYFTEDTSAPEEPERKPRNAAFSTVSRLLDIAPSGVTSLFKRKKRGR